MTNWKYKKRKIGGKVRNVKVAKMADGKVRVRVVKKRNYTDRTRIGKTRAK